MNDELDDLLGSLPTPPATNPDFWQPIDAAIADRNAAHPQQTDLARSVDEPDTSTDDTPHAANVTELPLRSPVAGAGQHRRMFIAAAAAVIAGVAVSIWPRPHDPVDVTAVGPATTQPAPIPTAAPSVLPSFDVTDGYVPPELLAEILPDGAELAFEPRPGDWTDDGVADVALAVRLASNELAVVVADGQTGTVTEPLTITGDTIGAFISRPGRLTITTSDDTTQTVTEIAVDDSGTRITNSTSLTPADRGQAVG